MGKAARQAVFAVQEHSYRIRPAQDLVPTAVGHAFNGAILSVYAVTSTFQNANRVRTTHKPKSATILKCRYRTTHTLIALRPIRSILTGITRKSLVALRASVALFARGTRLTRSTLFALVTRFANLAIQDYTNRIPSTDNFNTGAIF